MHFKSFWTVASRLRLLSIMIVLSGVLGVIGAIEITKCAKMHELNILHLKHNYLFSNAVLDFAVDEKEHLEVIERELESIRQQPVDCLGMLGLMERSVMSAVGTYRAVTICEEDIDLANQTLVTLTSFRQGTVTRRSFLTALKTAEKGFNENSVQFEPLVERTVSAVSSTVLVIVIAKAFFVAICGWLMAKSVSRDYDKLQTTEAKLERTHAELKNFVYRTSHDFKSPLVGIKSMAQFLEEDIAARNHDEALDNIRRIKRKIDMLEGVALSTLHVAKTDLAEERFETIELKSIISEIDQRLDAYAAERNVDIRTAGELEGLSLTTERAQLAAIIENLVSNGIKYSSDDREYSFVEIKARKNPNGALVVEVNDNGLGIPQEYQSEVFEMFKQFHPDRAQGSGLGMYIVKRSIERLNGEIFLQSSDEGTQIKVIIPNSPE